MFSLHTYLLRICWISNKLQNRKKMTWIECFYIFAVYNEINLNFGSLIRAEVNANGRIICATCNDLLLNCDQIFFATIAFDEFFFSFLQSQNLIVCSTSPWFFFTFCFIQMFTDFVGVRWPAKLFNTGFETKSYTLRFLT